MLDLEQQLAHERETNALLRLELQDIKSQLRVGGDTMSQAPRGTRPLAWQDKVPIVWWTVVGLGCLKLVVDWIGWQRFGIALGVLFWIVVFVAWRDPSKPGAATRSQLRKLGDASHDAPGR